MIEGSVRMQASNRQAVLRAATQVDSVHISVCVCTFKRPALLADLLQGLLNQTTDGTFTYSIVLVDNDRHESGRPTVERFQVARPEAIDYFVEPEQSIALA